MKNCCSFVQDAQLTIPIHFHNVPSWAIIVKYYESGRLAVILFESLHNIARPDLSRRPQGPGMHHKVNPRQALPVPSHFAAELHKQLGNLEREDDLQLFAFVVNEAIPFDEEPFIDGIHIPKVLNPPPLQLLLYLPQLILTVLIEMVFIDLSENVGGVQVHSLLLVEGALQLIGNIVEDLLNSHLHFAPQVEGLTEI